MWIGGKGLANMFKQEGETRDQSFTRNVAAFRHDIPSALWAELKHEGLLRADAPTP